MPITVTMQCVHCKKDVRFVMDHNKDNVYDVEVNPVFVTESTIGRQIEIIKDHGDKIKGIEIKKNDYEILSKLGSPVHRGWISHQPNCESETR